MTNGDWMVSVINDGTEYLLSDNDDYAVVSIAGLGHAEVARIAERGPMQHGITDRGYRLAHREGRIIQMVLEAKGGDRLAWLDRRQEISRIFRASGQPLRLRLTMVDWVRQIDCYLRGSMDVPVTVTAPFFQQVGITLVAPDPTWYDPNGVTEVFSLGAGGGEMEIPLDIPWDIGASVINATRQVAYRGTWGAWPIVTIIGPVTDCQLINETTGAKLDFTGATIEANDRFTIDCRYGYKTVTRASDGANRVRDLTRDSDLATFSIGAPPEVKNGLNSLRAKGNGANGATQIILQFQTRYVGV